MKKNFESPNLENYLFEKIKQSISEGLKTNKKVFTVDNFYFSIFEDQNLETVLNPEILIFMRKKLKRDKSKNNEEELLGDIMEPKFSPFDLKLKQIMFQMLKFFRKFGFKKITDFLLELSPKINE